MSYMLKQVRGVLELFFYNLVHIQVVDSMIYIIRFFGPGGVGMQGKIHLEVGADGSLLFETTVMGIEFHAPNGDNSHGIR